MFHDPKAKILNERYVMCRFLGGDDMTDEGRVFYKRYGIIGFPTIYVMNADGAVLTKVEYSQRSVGQFLAALPKAEKAQAEFTSRKKEILESWNPATRRELAGLYKERKELEQAREVYQQLIVDTPRAEDRVALMEVLKLLGDDDGRRRQLEALVRDYDGHEDHIQWRMQLLVFDLPADSKVTAERDANLEKHTKILEKLLKEVTGLDDQAAVRAALGNTFNALQKRDAAMEHYEWILSYARKSKAAAAALWNVGGKRFAEDPENPQRIQEVKAMLQEIISEHPKSPLVPNAETAMKQLDQRLEKLKEKKDEKGAGKE